jgi:hypothetical protein
MQQGCSLPCGALHWAGFGASTGCEFANYISDSNAYYQIFYSNPAGGTLTPTLASVKPALHQTVAAELAERTPADQHFGLWAQSKYSEAARRHFLVMLWILKKIDIHMYNTMQ